MNQRQRKKRFYAKRLCRTYWAANVIDFTIINQVTGQVIHLVGKGRISLL